MQECQQRRQKRMARVDAMKSDVRACVHDFGLTIVDACLAHGVTTGRGIRHIVQTVRSGSYQSQRDGAPMKRATADA